MAKAFLTISEISDEMRVTGEAVRRWIRAGELIGVQPVPNGVIRVPATAYEAFKRRRGLAPRLPMREPEGHGRSYTNAADFYAEAIEPALKRDGLSGDELLTRAATDPAFARDHEQLLHDYVIYVREIEGGLVSA